MTETLLKDLKHAARMFRKSPAFTFAAVAALALGIGANTAIFSVVNAVLLRPLPYPVPDRMVLFGVRSPQGQGLGASPAKFAHWRRQTSVVQDASAFTTGFMNFTGGEFPEQLKSAQVSASFFRLFGARTVLGRTFTNEEDLPNGGHYVVISKSLWEHRFANDAQIVGKSISLGGDPYTVVGVLGDFSFDDFGDTPDVLVPFQLDPNSTDHAHYFNVAGRLRPGVTLARANAELERSTKEFRSTFPNAIGENGAFDVVPMGEALVANVRKSLYVLLGAVGFVLLIAWRVLLFTIIVSLITGILFGLIPALTSARTDLSATFKEGSARSGSGFRQNRARSVLIVTEIALALVLLVGSALFIRTAVALSRVDPGFDARSVLTMRMSFGEERFTSSMAVEQAIRDGVQRVETIPGVELASATCCVPLQGGYGLPFTIAGRPLTNGPYSGGAAWTTVSPGYFEVFRIPVKRGRTFTDRDDANGTPVVIINEAMVREFWPDGNAIGAHITIGRGVMKPFATEPEREIIGVVGDTRDGGLNNDPQPQMFVPQAQIPDAVNALNTRLAPMAWVVRTRTEPLALSKAIQEQLRQATGLPVSSITSMDNVVHASTSRQRFNMWVMTVFAASALVLATIGIYGLMAYTVEQRTQEIGIRLALGADGSRVKNMVVLQGMRLVLVGVVVGVAASFGLTHIIATFLFGVAPWDPLVLVGVPLLLTTVALIAVWWPARRASQVDPLNALRYE